MEVIKGGGDGGAGAIKIKKEYKKKKEKFEKPNGLYEQCRR